MGGELGVGRVKQGTAARCYSLWYIQPIYMCNFDKNEKIQKLNQEKQSEERQQSQW